MVTQKEIAKQLGISQKTVSRVINGSTDVKPETHEKVMALLRKSNYTLNASARNLCKQKSGLIGVLVAKPEAFNSIYFLQTFKGINEIINQHNYHLMFSILSEEKDIDTLLLKADGFIIFNINGISKMFPEALAEINKRKKEKVIIQSINTGAYPFISVDNFSGGYDATTHLLQLGHRKIAFLGYGGNPFESSQRFDGYKSAMKDLSLSIKEEWIYCLKDKSAIDHVDFILNLSVEKRPSAIVTWSDKSAIQMILEFQKRGLKLPEDMSITGFDDRHDLVDLTHPQLTTMRQPFYELGIAVTDMLFDLMNNPKKREQSIFIKPRLVKRQSAVEYSENQK
jgi:LacI family transcriptional regulator, galactose operon repressor